MTVASRRQARDYQDPGVVDRRHDRELPRERKRDSQLERYVEKVGRFRIFHLSLPKDTVAQVGVELDLRRLRSMNAVGGPQREAVLAKEDRLKDQCKRAILLLREEFERNIESWLGQEPERQNESYTPASVLSGLRDSSITDAYRRELVIQAELLRFGEEQKPVLLSVLWDFIRAYRDSNEFDSVIAVGSAIRKYVANMKTADIGSIATLLEVGHTGTPVLDLELEIVKMIYRSFEADPPAKSDPEPELAERVYEIARAYLQLRVLPHGKHGIVAMLAVQALVAMQSERASDAIKIVNTFPLAHRGFREQLWRRLNILRERWAGHPKAIRNLSKLKVNLVEN